MQNSSGSTVTITKTEEGTIIGFETHSRIGKRTQYFTNERTIEQVAAIYEIYGFKLVE